METKTKRKRKEKFQGCIYWKKISLLLPPPRRGGEWKPADRSWGEQFRKVEEKNRKEKRKKRKEKKGNES
jgi:hypothetical protein